MCLKRQDISFIQCSTNQRLLTLQKGSQNLKPTFGFFFLKNINLLSKTMMLIFFCQSQAVYWNLSQNLP